MELTRNSADYEEDFYAWTVEQARLLRSGDLSAIDIENIAEEIESMGRSDRRAIESRLDRAAGASLEVAGANET